MVLLQKKKELTNDEIKRFQQHVNAFFVTWVSLVSHEGVTNYIHMLGAGHIGEYLLHHHNLYKHSQQGWEAFNSLLKTFFFHRTGRGGAGNCGTSMKSKIIPIAQWLSRCVLWLMGFDYDKVLEQLQIVHQNDDYGDTNDIYKSDDSDGDSDSTENEEIIEENNDEILFNN